MKRGDMAQLDDDQRINRQIRATALMGLGIFLMLVMATIVGVFFGWLIWGIE